MSAKVEPLVFVARKRIKDDGRSPSSLELYDLMQLLSCGQAEMKWMPDWSFCPVCLAQVDMDGELIHKFVVLL